MFTILADSLMTATRHHRTREASRRRAHLLRQVPPHLHDDVALRGHGRYRFNPFRDLW
ncbi:hypothetical protein [Mesobaculum littorinae]|uniref:hypothetical protein n=1 Tax=Mesobaculum littorinae TaxID=2486419 RepID=UPI0013E3229A|nr:hypothetical protein [Mesobaculum littorinae]